ncbi:hypothetical protein HK100_006297, partial [Physocladia obscura]
MTVVSKIAPQFRRAAILYVPGSDERKVAKAFTHKTVDTRVLDLEDSVTIQKKSLARSIVCKTLANIPPQSNNSIVQETCVRINSVTSGLAESDLAAILPFNSLDSILVPKVNSASDIHFIQSVIAQHRSNTNIKILVGIESAKGLINLPHIIDASNIGTANDAGVDFKRRQGQIEALVFAAEDYAADLGLIRTPERTEMLFARQMVVTHAVANGLQAIDLVCVDFKNESVLRKECREGRTFGFTGKQAIHPDQVEIIQSCFLPSEIELKYAARILAEAGKYSGQGVGAFELDGKMIDAV